MVTTVCKFCVCVVGGGEGGGGKVSVKRVNKRPRVGVWVGGYCHIWAICECAAVKDMVFKQFTPESLGLEL